MTSLNPSLRLALINKAKVKKNLLEKGFTLIELMITVAVVGLLSGIAIPQFLNYQETAKAKAAAGEVTRLAGPCSNAKAIKDVYPPDYTGSAAVIASANCSEANQDTDIVFTSQYSGLEGDRCGTFELTADGKVCETTVAGGSGLITYDEVDTPAGVTPTP